MNSPYERQKIVCVLYDDPADGYPPKYARDDIPMLKAYSDGQSMPSPSAINFPLVISSVVYQESLVCENFWKIVVTRLS